MRAVGDRFLHPRSLNKKVLENNLLHIQDRPLELCRLRHQAIPAKSELDTELKMRGQTLLSDARPNGADSNSQILMRIFGLFGSEFRLLDRDSHSAMTFF